jgi:hypothetical protein
VELLIALGGFSGLATLIGAVWGIVRYYDKKKTERDTQQQLRDAERDKLLKDILIQLNTNSLTNESQKHEIAEMRKDIKKVHEQLDKVQAEAQDTRRIIEENEMDRLRSDIILYQNQLENGLSLNQAALEHVHHCYDKYHAKGGNSYIDGCMESIKEYERECRENGIIGFDNQ